MNKQETKFISLYEAAKLTNYSQDYISLLCRQKKMKGMKIGRNWVTTKEWVENYINETKGNGQNVITVKIKSAEDTEEKVNIIGFLASKLRTQKQFLFSKGLIPAVIVVVIIAGAFVFSQEYGANDSSSVIARSINDAAIPNSDTQNRTLSQNEINDEIATVSASWRIPRNDNIIVSSLNHFSNSITTLSNSLDVISNCERNVASNFAESVKVKLAGLSYSKDIIFSSVFGKEKQGRVAGVSSNALQQAQDDNVIASLSNHFSNSIITLSDSLNAIKNKSNKFTSDKIISFSNSLNTVKNETAKFAINEIDKLYYSCELIKNKSEEKIRIALSKFGIGEDKELSPESSGLSSLSAEEAKAKEAVDELEQEIIGDIQKRFDEFSREQAYLSPTSQNYGAAIVPYSDEDDKEAKIKNLKEAFSDDVSIEEDADGGTGTITPNIPGVEQQKYLYLMMPMGE